MSVPTTTGKLAQRGQGMTEYIIIVALIAIAAIGIYRNFGTAVRGQTGVAVGSLAGDVGAANSARDIVRDDAAQRVTGSSAERTMSDFEERAND
jgi:type IV pilus assembly protein PilA